MRATSRAGSALAATTLAAFFALGDAAEVTVKISYPDRDAGSTAARVLVATLVTLAVSMLVWMVLRRRRALRRGRRLLRQPRSRTS